MRKEVDAYLIASGVPYTIVNQGVFTEALLLPYWLNWFSIQDAKVSYWCRGIDQRPLEVSGSS